MFEENNLPFVPGNKSKDVAPEDAKNNGTNTSTGYNMHFIGGLRYC